MKILLINPKFPDSFWSFKYAVDNILPRVKAVNPPLGLATVAALMPKDWEVEIIDENIESVPVDTDADIIGITGMLVQYERQKTLINYYKNKGYFVIVGGCAASLCPEFFENLADVVISGEAEYIWKEFCEDFEDNRWKKLYKSTSNVDLDDVPVPRFDLLKMDRYRTATMQFSRGCPFNCDFCDIIVMFGRKPRTKNLNQVKEELEALREQGVTNVFFVDDNFIGNKAKAKELLKFLIEYNKDKKVKFTFGTEVSLNIVKDDDLLKLFRDANFGWLFIGIESLDETSLKQAGKYQNMKINVLDAIRKIYSYGIEVFGGFIVGFDNDRITVFKDMYNFIIKSGIQVAMVGLLYAPPKTPLYERLYKEGRIIKNVDINENTQLETNVLPKNMEYGEMIDGYKNLYLKLYRDRDIYLKIINKFKYFKKNNIPKGNISFRLAFNVLFKGIIKGGPVRIYYFLMSLLRINPAYFVLVCSDWVAGITMKDYAMNNFIKKYNWKQIVEGINKIKSRTSHYIKKGFFDIEAIKIKERYVVITLLLKSQVEKRLISKLCKRVKKLLIKSDAYVVLHIDYDNINKSHLEYMLKYLRKYSKDIKLKINEKIATAYNINLNLCDIEFL
ncbi:MAG: radical SAM protein [Deferribacterota bacterium]|nr:radical SAM protein [Deferribacterota bacterium]